MKTTTDSNGNKQRIFYLKNNLFSLSIEDEFRQSLNVTISVRNPSPSTNLQVYYPQRTIHCQKQVSI
jgi:hypothetical protein